MREILFRGKDAGTGAWRIGDLMHVNGRSAIHVDGDEYIVVPDTVGQYSGVVSHNRMRIFEGDIVHCKAVVSVNFEEMRDYVGLVKRYQNTFSISSGNYISFNWMNFQIDVIGNVYDNPELLEASE